MKDLLIRSLSGICIVLVLLYFIYSNDFVFDLSFLFIVASIMAMEWGEMVSKTENSNKKNKWFLIGVVYILLTILPILNIKLYYQESNHLLMWLFLLVWSTDTFAYIVGAKLNLGKHKINKISPKKSYEGLIGGIVAASAICYIFANIFLPELKIILLIATPFLCCIEQLSDFTESYVKRKFDVKDSGSIIPGHGGFLDRFDGFLFTGLVYTMLLDYLLF